MLMLMFLACLALTAESSYAGPRLKNLEVRQPLKGLGVHKMSSSEILNRSMKSAAKSADRLSAQVQNILEVTSMGTIERWRKGIDLSLVKEDFSRGVVEHMKSVTQVLKIRAQSGGRLAGIKEFEFLNLMNKSDYILSVYVTQESLKHALQNDTQSVVAEAVASYNKERSRFDQKVLRVTSLQTQ